MDGREVLALIKADEKLRTIPTIILTTSEAEAYRAYVDEYARYWRQYFDPIAMRLDDAPGGALELSTFILPLLDSQLYNQVRGFLAVREGGAALRVPVVAPDPVFLLSLNLTEDAWTKISGSWSELFSGYTGISPAIFDRLGPGIHVAVQDADPIIVLGNADLLGSFSGPMLTAELMGGWLPLLFAVLTRPGHTLDPHDLPPRHELIPIELHDSSTVIRERLLHGNDASALLTGPALRYIQRYGLYRGTNPASWSGGSLEELYPAIRELNITGTDHSDGGNF